jgi:hypothetical protein
MAGKLTPEEIAKLDEMMEYVEEVDGLMGINPAGGQAPPPTVFPPVQAPPPTFFPPGQAPLQTIPSSLFAPPGQAPGFATGQTQLTTAPMASTSTSLAGGGGGGGFYGGPPTALTGKMVETPQGLIEFLAKVEASGIQPSIRNFTLGELGEYVSIPNLVNPGQRTTVLGVVGDFYPNKTTPRDYFIEMAHIRPIWRWAGLNYNGITYYLWYNNYLKKFITKKEEEPNIPIQRRLFNAAGTHVGNIVWDPVDHTWKYPHEFGQTRRSLLDPRVIYNQLNNKCPRDDPYDLTYQSGLCIGTEAGKSDLYSYAERVAAITRMGGKRKTRHRKVKRRTIKKSKKSRR